MVSIPIVLRVLLVVFATATQLVQCIPYYDGKIVGGKDAEIKDFPYQVSVQSFNSHICGGSIISRRHVLTAAHCTYNSPTSSLSILYNVTTLRSPLDPGTRVTVQTILQHPDYKSENLGVDVTVLKLTLPIILSNTARIIPLTFFEPVTPGLPLRVTGWGATREGGSGSRILQVVEVELVSRESCKRSYQGRPIRPIAIDQSMICAGVPSGGKDSCHGDSGGALVRTVFGVKVQVGIVSFGIGCGRQAYPGVYSNVANLQTFIYRAMLA